MKVGLVVDAGCDLPRSFIDDNNILVLPVNIQYGGNTVIADRNEATMQQFYSGHANKQAHDAQSTPFTADEIKQLLLDRAVTQFDFVIMETVPKSRSAIFDNATDASHSLLSEYKEVRKEAGLDGPFATRVIDSQTLFAGQGVLAAETVRMVNEGKSGSAIVKKIDTLSHFVTALAVVPDLGYLRKRAKKRGDKSVGWAGVLLGSALDIKPILCARRDDTFAAAKVRGFEHAVEAMFDHSMNAIHAGLMAPIVCISYAGDVADVEQMPGFAKLARTCERKDIQLLTAPMGLTGAVNVGPGSISIGLITNNFPFLDNT